MKICFFNINPNFQPQSINATIQTDVYVGNGKLTPTYLGVNKAFGLTMDFEYQVPAQIALNGFNVSKPIILNFYDELNETFIYLPTFKFGDTKMKPVPAVSGMVFDPQNVKKQRKCSCQCK